MKKIEEDPNEWDLYLDETLMQLRNRRRVATGYSPFELMHTWQFRFTVQPDGQNKQGYYPVMN